MIIYCDKEPVNGSVFLDHVLVDDPTCLLIRYGLLSCIRPFVLKGKDLIRNKKYNIDLCTDSLTIKLYDCIFSGNKVESFLKHAGILVKNT